MEEWETIADIGWFQRGRVLARIMAKVACVRCRTLRAWWGGVAPLRHQRTCDAGCPTTSAMCRNGAIAAPALPVLCMLPLLS